MKRYIPYITLSLLTLPCAVGAQTDGTRLAGNAIAIERKVVEKAGDNLVVDLTLNMDSLRLPANTRFVFTPLVKSADREVLMSPVIVNGRRQDISFRRRGYKDYAPDVQAVRRKNGTPQAVSYHAVVPYEEWMKNADVVIAEDLCGCGGSVEDSRQVVLRRMRTPLMPFVRPQAEAVKARAEKGSAFIDFPVNRTELHPDYRNNPRELDKIIKTIDRVKTDKNLSITSVEIHGYASPESPYEHNAMLAAGRARTLKDYVARIAGIDDRLFTVASTPEDWEGLRNRLVDSSLPHKDDILKLVDDSSLDPDAKEARIKQLYPDDYRTMLTTWYPALRHSDYVVSYTVRPFSVEEAKQVLKTDPRQLSLEEMFLVAQTYEPGSREFNDVMETAVKMYPDDATANLNAACARMQAGDLDGARRYLDKAGSSPDALHARGVLALLEGHSDEARRLLSEAAKGGAKGAADNLRLLDM